MFAIEAALEFAETDPDCSKLRLSFEKRLFDKKRDSDQIKPFVKELVKKGIEQTRNGLVTELLHHYGKVGKWRENFMSRVYKTRQ
jgi:hypothetical protein